MTSRLRRCASSFRRNFGFIALVSGQFMCAIRLTFDAVGAPIPTIGVSMMPTMNYFGDVVWYTPLSYWRPLHQWGGWSTKLERRPKRGELVVVDNPTDPSYYVCKRVIGVEGDLVEMDPRRDGIVWDPSRHSLDRKRSAGRDDGEMASVAGQDRWGHSKYVRIPKGYIWIAGDNLSSSTDSRHYGPVPLASVRGKVIARVSAAGRTLEYVGWADGAVKIWKDGRPDWTRFDSNVRVIGECDIPSISSRL